MSRHGIDASEVGVEPGLCASTFLQDIAYVIENAATDSRSQYSIIKNRDVVRSGLKNLESLVVDVAGEAFSLEARHWFHVDSVIGAVAVLADKVMILINGLMAGPAVSL